MTLMSNIALFLALGSVFVATPLAAQAIEPEAHAAIKRLCLPPAESREEIKSRHFLEPFAVLKSAAPQFKAEALSAKLCHLGDEFVYEIALLHRDGRLFHAVMNAATGKLLSAHNAREPMPKIDRKGRPHDMRLLVVEDDRDLNRQIATALESRRLRRRPRLRRRGGLVPRRHRAL